MIQVRNSIVAKLWVTIVGMVILVWVLLSVLLQQFFDNYVYAQQSRELTRLSQTIHVLLEDNTLAKALQISNQLASVQDARIQIAVPYQSNQDLTRAYQALTAEQQHQLQAGESVTVRGSTSGGETVSVYMLVHSNQGTGLQVVSQQMSVLNGPMVRMRNLILFACVLGVLMTTGLAFVVSKNLSRPLVQMNRVAEQMANGNFDGQIQVVTNDEVGRLGRTFNALAGQLERTIAALTMETDQLSSILKSLEDGVVAATLSGTITLANPPALRMLGHLGLRDGADGAERTLPAGIQDIMDQAVAKRRTVVREIAVQGRSVVVTMTPLHEADGTTLRGVVGVLRDVTEERKLDRLRKDFIANVSHELRTPLSMMQGYAEALQDEFGDNPEQRRELADIIHDETLRMKRLVNDLLDLAQLESGQFQMNFQHLDLTRTVRKVRRKFQALALEQGVQLVTEIPVHPVWVRGDPDRLEQVFTNLMDNAIRHTGSGGRVAVGMEAAGGSVKVWVADTGSGIPVEDLPYIWERFYKADKARTRGNSGIGLGLAITRHIVLEHRGDIAVESQLGQGTTFTVTLPGDPLTPADEDNDRA
ncbi:sensor histidine kinase ResE [Alicyclobacillus contaminans]|uniref:sensor histidine kinase n=1 Tax=Alicyclobacillus contaminans TaxID=392016 RepID=UPI0003F53E92|nr:ATP-binding protein [Alicyclobacillus contaminans]GMA52481.1 sensor histidine kinase ResE [Alicyclobacillus contaminans]